MKVLTFFNNKGGVGKTTLTANVAAYFAIKRQQRVLVVDCDPQCNITQLLLGDEETIDIYWSTKKRSRISTLLNVITPILDGDSSVDDDVVPMKSSSNRFSVDLLPGHPRFSMMEDPLSQHWGQLPSGKPAAFRVSNWLHSYIRAQEGRYDLVLVDVGPSLGSINRSVLIASDYFVAPLGADVFSLLGVRNIARWLDDWIRQYQAGLKYAGDVNNDSLDRFDFKRELTISEGFIGYTLQQYIAKSKGGVRRPTAAFEKILSNVPNDVTKSLGKYTSSNINDGGEHLGDVPNLYSLIPLAQSVNAPIFGMKSSDGLVGTQYKQSQNYEEIIGRLSNRMLSNMGISS